MDTASYYVGNHVNKLKIPQPRYGISRRIIGSKGASIKYKSELLQYSLNEGELSGRIDSHDTLRICKRLMVITELGDFCDRLVIEPSFFQFVSDHLTCIASDEAQR